ncbi:MAG: SAM-dependent methyltransferase [Promicromonosporaceae bacterium]|nr:SAM-dependent methyltransferase [Promicromonosporaceae bacterium]
MGNERATEDLVDDRLRQLGYYADDRIIVEKQKSQNNQIADALRKSSKRGSGKVGFPEFIITSLDAPDTVIVIECKASVKNHESANRDRPVDFAVDGALHYGRFLAITHTVIAIAVSGTKADARWSIFLLPKESKAEQPLLSRHGAEITALASMSDMLVAAAFDPTVQHRRQIDLIDFSSTMHEFMRDEAELEEKEKPLAVAGSLIALLDPVFQKTYDDYPADRLPEFWIKTIKDALTRANLPQGKQDTMTQPFTNIEVHPELGKATLRFPKGLLNAIVTMLAEQVAPYLTIYHDFDVVGQFYGEFLKYTGGDGKGLGIVLTPRHVTELFAMLANVTVDDKVLDPCSGTGGFLISSLKHAASHKGATDSAVERFKRDGMIGIEQQATMFALSASNMILRGDGKANLHQGSCFDTAIATFIECNVCSGPPEIAATPHECRAPTIGMLNPPYSKSKADLSELRFVENMLSMLRRGATGIAIIPVSCATGGGRHGLLERHTLEAVMSMPPELFYPVGVVTCIMVFTAHIPHAASKKKTWFGYWRDDTFVKVKNRGRIDRDGTWPDTRDRWLEMYRNREVHAGESVTRHVTADDEWLAEAYIETDYSTLTEADFAKVLRDYALFTLRGVSDE